jgi:nucleoside-diphosphate-sugar epimerase
VIKLLATVAGKKIQAKYEPARSGDILHSQADISLAKKVLGYEPRVGFEEGLKRTWEWYSAAFAKT